MLVGSSNPVSAPSVRVSQMVREYNIKKHHDSPVYDGHGGSLSDTELYMSPKTFIKQKVLKHPENRGAGFRNMKTKAKVPVVKIDGQYQTSKEGTLE